MGLPSSSSKAGSVSSLSSGALSTSNISPEGCGSASDYGQVSGTGSRVGISSGTYTQWVEPGGTVRLSGTHTGTSSWSVSADIGLSASLAVAGASATVGGSYGQETSNSMTSSVSYTVPQGEGNGRIMVYIEGARYEEYHQTLNLDCIVDTSYAWVNVPQVDPAALWGLQMQYGSHAGLTTPW